MSPRRMLVIVSTALALLAAACESDPPAPTATPSSAFPSSTPSSTEIETETTSPPLPTDLPSPGADAGDLTAGSLDLSMRGDVVLQTRLTRLLTGVVAPPPSGFAVVFGGRGTDPTTVGLGGVAFVGSQPTATTLVLTIVAPAPGGFSTWVSTEGECDVRISVAEPTHIAGSFTCDGLVSGTGEVAEISGSFEATR